MRTGVLLTISWALIPLSFTCAQAQDQVRDREKNSVDAVDPSVRAAVDGQPQEPQLSQSRTKQPATLSSWSLHPARHAPTTLFPTGQSTTSDAALAGGKNPSVPGSASFQPTGQPSASTVWSFPGPAAYTPAINGNSGEHSGAPNLVIGLAVRRASDNSTWPLALKTPAPPTSALFEPQGFSAPFAWKQSGPTRTSAFPITTRLSLQNKVKAKRTEAKVRKSVGPSKTVGSWPSPQINKQ